MSSLIIIKKDQRLSEKQGCARLMNHRAQQQSQAWWFIVFVFQRGGMVVSTAQSWFTLILQSFVLQSELQKSNLWGTPLKRLLRLSVGFVCRDLRRSGFIILLFYLIQEFLHLFSARSQSGKTATSTSDPSDEKTASTELIRWSLFLTNPSFSSTSSFSAIIQNCQISL